MIAMMMEQVTVPFLVDAGVVLRRMRRSRWGTGCDAVPLNSEIAHAKDPVRMAKAMKLAAEVAVWRIWRDVCRGALGRSVQPLAGLDLLDG